MLPGLACAVFLALASTEMTTVYLIPHSHDDPGWMQTIDEYYEGFDQYHYGIRKMYNSILETLVDKPHRRFIAVEILFFSRWWSDKRTTDLKRQQWKGLLQNGQIEFVGGGYVMNDEISTGTSVLSADFEREIS
jgi:hypothetical protein